MALRPRRGAQVDYPVFRTIEIRPIAGFYTPLSHDIPVGGSPDMSNMAVWKSRLIKRPGYAQWQSGNAAIGTTVTGLYSIQDDENNTHLFATHETGLEKYNTTSDDWDTITGTALTGGINPMRFELSQSNIVFTKASMP